MCAPCCSPDKAPAAIRDPTPWLTNSRQRLGVGKIERPLYAVQPDGTHARAGDHLADYRRLASQGVRPYMRQHVFRFFAGDGDHQLAFIGEVQGVQPEQLADSAHGVVDRQLRLVQFNAAAAGGGELMGDGVDAAAGGVAQGFDARSGRRV